MPLRFAWEKPAPHSTPCFASPRVELAVMQFASPLALCAFGSQPGETCTLSDIARFLSKSWRSWPADRSGFWLMHVCRVSALLAGASHHKWNSKCFSEYLN